MSDLKPNEKFDHAFAIIRVDCFIDPPTNITVKKVVWDEDFAQQEVDRLNKINADKECYYFHQLTRVERK